MSIACEVLLTNGVRVEVYSGRLSKAVVFKAEKIKESAFALSPSFCLHGMHF